MQKPKQHVTHASSVFNGVLLDAADYRALVAQCDIGPVREGLGDYAIRAGASMRFIAQLRDGKMAYKCRLTAFPSPRNRMMLAMTIQAGVCQSRILFDLGSPRARAMLASAWKSKSQRILFTADGAGRGTEFDLAVPETAAENLLKLPIVKHAEMHWLEDTADLAFVASHLRSERDALLVAGLAAPQDISVTEVVTYEGIGESISTQQFA